MSLSSPPESAVRVLFNWRKQRPAPEEAPAPPEVAREDPTAAITTRTEAARALLYAARSGIDDVVVDATPDDWTPPECRSAHGRRLPTSVAWETQSVSGEGGLPHRTESGAPCRCRYRAAPPGAEAPARRPIDARWHE